MGICRASFSAMPTSHVTSERVQARAHKCTQMPKSRRFPSHTATPNFGSITYMVPSTWDKSLVMIRLTVLLQYSETSVWGGPGSYKAHHISPILQFLEYRFLSHANYTILSMKIPTAGCTDTGKPSASTTFLLHKLSQPSYAAKWSRELVWCNLGSSSVTKFSLGTIIIAFYT